MSSKLSGYDVVVVGIIAALLLALAVLTTAHRFRATRFGFFIDHEKPIPPPTPPPPAPPPPQIKEMLEDKDKEAAPDPEATQAMTRVDWPQQER